MSLPTAAIVTVGSELTQGLRLDTNTAEIARELAPRGLVVAEALSVGDDPEILAAQLARLTSLHALVITTGGLGPTHDDVTREAASDALGLELVTDTRLVEMLTPFLDRHTDPAAAQQVLTQAEVLPGAEVIDPTTGTAPGLVMPTPAGLLALLPGPPSEMRPMLQAVLTRFPLTQAAPRELGVTGMTESDAQVAAQRALAGHAGVGFTVLARPGDVRVILTDQTAGEAVLSAAAHDVAETLGAHCYTTDGATLAEVVIREAIARRLTISLAESCTGGMVAAALTDVPGSSAVFLGGVVSYSDASKIALLGVEDATLESHGAVSGQTVEQMGTGAQRVFGTDIAVAVSGIAGPEGGTDQKPVGTVWFDTRGPSGSAQVPRLFPGTSRGAIRARATAYALDLLRRQVLGLEVTR